MLPFFYETAQDQKASEILGGFATKYFVLFGLVSLLAFTIARPLLLLAAHSKFHEAINYIPFIVLAGWLNIDFNIFYWSLMHSKKTYLHLDFAWGISHIDDRTAFCFAQDHGTRNLGVVYAMVAVALFKNVIGYFLSQRYFKLRYHSSKIVLGSTLTILTAGFAIHFLPKGPSLLQDMILRLVFFAVTLLIIQKTLNVSFLRWGLLLSRTSKRSG